MSEKARGVRRKVQTAATYTCSDGRLLPKQTPFLGHIAPIWHSTVRLLLTYEVLYLRRYQNEICRQLDGE